MALRIFSQALSYIFHPLFLIAYALLLLHLVNPYLFVGNNFDFAQLMARIIQFTIVLPAASIFVMRGLGFIDGLEMRTNNERVVPYIATGVFYIWTYLNMADNIGIPPVFRAFVLGASLALAVSFFVNIFSKISMHAVGMGGFLAMLFLTFLFHSYTDISTLLLVGIVVTGAVGTARLLLKAHTPNDVFLGYMVGFVAQFLAYRILVGV